ncbi:MAG: S8 family serine peptidase [Armatimonadetes bacterium]|nr:S8 family serine peptidase [Armatimonadota bacterium]
MNNFNRTLYRLAVLVLALWLAGTYGVQADYAPGEVIVIPKAGKLAAMPSLLAAQGATVKNTSSRLGSVTLKLPKGQSVQEAVNALKKDPNVAYAGPNHILRIALLPNDPLLRDGYDLLGIGYFTEPQWGLYNDGSNNSYGGKLRADIHAPEAWEITTGSPNVVIAIIDTGIDYTHPDIQDKVWINAGEIPNNGIDDDNNGYVDDWRGWNFLGAGSNDPMDDNSEQGLAIHHGTFTAGVAGASSDNGEGIAGVSWDSPVMALKVIGADGSGLEDDAARAVVYAADNGAKVINMSLTGEDAPLLHQAVDYAWSKGALVVCASGNENLSTPTYPASYQHALSVGATNEYDERCTAADWLSGGSNYGDYLDVMAPGNNILSLTDAVEPGGYYTLPGTSAAAPFVSGIAALIWSVHPDWTNQQVFDQIVRTCDDIGTPGWDMYTGWGRVNAYRALTEVSSETATIAELKTMPLNSSVLLKGKVLTVGSGQIANRLYIQDASSYAGILLYFAESVPAGLAQGDTVEVFGKLGTVSGELAITGGSVTRMATAPVPKPVTMRNKALGGGTTGNQQGVVDHYSLPRQMAIGASNIGVLASAWGKVTAIGFDWFYIDDGAGLDDGTGNTGVYVNCGPLVRPGLNKIVRVTGISSCDIPQGATVARRVLRPRQQSDIEVLK